MKWYSFEYPSVLASCPRSVTTVRKAKCIKPAVFSELPLKKKLNPLRDPFAGSPRYHLGLSTPNSENVTSMLMDSVIGGKMVNQ